jgi:hypothetical protein
MVNRHECASIGLFRLYFSMDGELPYRKSEPVAHDGSLPGPPPPGILDGSMLACGPAADGGRSCREEGHVVDGDAFPQPPRCRAVEGGLPIDPEPVMGGQFPRSKGHLAIHYGSLPDTPPLAAVAGDPPRAPAISEDPSPAPEWIVDGKPPNREWTPVGKDDSAPAPLPLPAAMGGREHTFREAAAVAHDDYLLAPPPFGAMPDGTPPLSVPVADEEHSFREREPEANDVSLPAPPPVVAIEDGPPPEPPPLYIAPVPGPVPRLLAGLESGILGAAVMIAWFAMDSLLESQYWWAMLYLWGASVYHNRVFSMGFGVATLAGASTHFFLHGLGGALWSLLAGRISNYWLHLFFSFAAAAAWYWLLMYTFWPIVAPVVSRITPLPATFLAYFLFGAALSRSARRARQLSAIWQS